MCQTWDDGSTFRLGSCWSQSVLETTFTRLGCSDGQVTSISTTHQIVTLCDVTRVSSLVSRCVATASLVSITLLLLHQTHLGRVLTSSWLNFNFMILSPLSVHQSCNLDHEMTMCVHLLTAHTVLWSQVTLHMCWVPGSDHYWALTMLECLHQDLFQCEQCDTGLEWVEQVSVPSTVSTITISTSISKTQYYNIQALIVYSLPAAAEILSTNGFNHINSRGESSSLSPICMKKCFCLWRPRSALSWPGHVSDVRLMSPGWQDDSPHSRVRSSYHQQTSPGHMPHYQHFTSFQIFDQNIFAGHQPSMK